MNKTISDIEKSIWVERFRPTTLADLILPARLLSEISGLLSHDILPNLLLSGETGIGKTSLAKSIVNDLEADSLFINASLDRNIDTVRTEVVRFVTGRSLTGKRKVVILDEVDNMTKAAQLSLKSLIETHSKNAMFIFTSNYINRIEPALVSRTAQIDYNFSKEEKKQLKIQYLKRTISILDELEIKYDRKVIINVIQKYFPDFRAILNQLHKFSSGGEISIDILTHIHESDITVLMDILRDKNFANLKEYIKSVDSERSIINGLVKNVDMVVGEDIPQFLSSLTTCDSALSKVGNTKLCLLFHLTTILTSVKFK